jgi:RimJ/RimL family protein N-acetyltransferase
MSHGLFPERIETDRLLLDRLSFDTVEPLELYELSRTDGWATATDEHMPWFGFDRPDQVCDFIEECEDDWADREGAAYAVRPTGDEPRAGDLAGFRTFDPEWRRDRAGSDVVLAEPFWGRGYGTESGTAMVRLTFDRFCLGAFLTKCAAGNDRSRRMIERYVVDLGGQCDGLLRHENPRPNGRMTDQYRFSLLREEYEAATAGEQSTDNAG